MRREIEKYAVMVFVYYRIQVYNNYIFCVSAFRASAAESKKGAEYGGFPRFLRLCSHSL